MAKRYLEVVESPGSSPGGLICSYPSAAFANKEKKKHMHEDNVQEPLVRLGTTFDISGNQATVVGFTKRGVRLKIAGRKEELPPVEFAMIEKAVRLTMIEQQV